MRDLDAERAEKATATITAPEKPVLPKELTKDGKVPTKKQVKAVCIHALLQIPYVWRKYIDALNR